MRPRQKWRWCCRGAALVTAMLLQGCDGQTSSVSGGESREAARETSSAPVRETEAEGEAPGPFVQEIPHTGYQFKMVYIPGGTFVMGSPPDEQGRRRTEGPQHEVKVDAFWMSSHEINWNLFFYWLRRDEVWNEPRPLRDDDPLQLARKLPRPGLPKFAAVELNARPFDDKQPAIGISQYLAQEFCRWLTVRTGRAYRLPTEAEWEYAARAGTTTAYFFGDDARLLDEYAWYKENSEGGTHRVGQKKPNPWGLYDIYGNAAEWVLDGWSMDYSAYAGGVSVNPWVERPAKGQLGVIRGGDWSAEPAELRSAWRAADNDTLVFIEDGGWWNFAAWIDWPEDDKKMHVGFRVVSPAAPPAPGDRRYAPPEMHDYDGREPRVLTRTRTSRAAK